MGERRRELGVGGATSFVVHYLALVLIAAPIAGAVQVCTIERTVMLKPSDISSRYRDKSQHILVSSLDKNISYSLRLPGCEAAWTSFLPGDLPGNLSKLLEEEQVLESQGVDGRIWYEVSYNIQEQEERLLRVAISYNSQQYSSDARVVNCTADIAELTFANDTLVGRYCTTPHPIAHDTSMITIIVIVAVVVVLFIVVDLICFFHHKTRLQTKADMANKAAATTPQSGDMSLPMPSTVPLPKLSPASLPKPSLTPLPTHSFSSPSSPTPSTPHPLPTPSPRAGPVAPSFPHPPPPCLPSPHALDTDVSYKIMSQVVFNEAPPPAPPPDKEENSGITDRKTSKGEEGRRSKENIEGSKKETKEGGRRPESRGWMSSFHRSLTLQNSLEPLIES